MSLEALLGHRVVWLELNPHVVLEGRDDIGFLWAAELPIKLGVRAQPAAHFHIVVFTHLMDDTHLQPEEDRAAYLKDSGKTYIVSFRFKAIKHQGDPVLSGGHQLPHTVLVVWVFVGPAGGGEGAVQNGDKAATSSCWRKKNNKKGLVLRNDLHVIV